MLSKYCCFPTGMIFLPVTVSTWLVRPSCLKYIAYDRGLHREFEADFCWRTKQRRGFLIAGRARGDSLVLFFRHSSYSYNPRPGRIDG